MKSIKDILSGKILACLIFIVVTFALVGCEEPKLIQEEKPETTIIITSENGQTTLVHDEKHENTLKLTAIVSTQGSRVLWTSSNENIAKVNQKGEVYLPQAGISYGFVEIEATSLSDGAQSSIELFVPPQIGYEKNEGVWKIYTAEGLLAWNEHVMKNTGTAEEPVYSNLKTNAKLIADISLPEPEEGGSNWSPVGIDWNNEYSGTFDGNGKTISNLTVIGTEEASIGLFSYIGTDGIVQDVNLEDTELKGARHIGGIAGYNFGRILGCNSNGYFETPHDYGQVGGIVGSNWNTIANCYSSGELKSTFGDVGGIAGYAQDSIITECFSSCHILSNGVAGGIAGTNHGLIAGCKNSGDIDATYIEKQDKNVYAGGITGYNSGTIAGSCNQGNLNLMDETGCKERDAIVGGVVGKAYSSDSTGIVIGSYNIGRIKAFNKTVCYAAGIVGFNSIPLIGCYSNNNVEADFPSEAFGGTGAVTGYYDFGTKYTAVYWKGNISGKRIVGELEGTSEVDGSSVTWQTATEDMNRTIEDWNRNHPDNTCNYIFKQESSVESPILVKLQ